MLYDDLEDWLADLRKEARRKGDHTSTFSGYFWVDLFHRGVSPADAIARNP